MPDVGADVVTLAAALPDVVAPGPAVVAFPTGGQTVTEVSSILSWTYGLMVVVVTGV